MRYRKKKNENTLKIWLLKPEKNFPVFALLAFSGRTMTVIRLDGDAFARGSASTFSLFLTERPSGRRREA